MVNIKTALKNAYQNLKGISDTAHLDSQVLLCFVLDVEKPYLIAHDDRELTDDEQFYYDKLVARRSTGEPIAYLIGYRDFWDLRFTVSPAVLIPRPETEHLIEVALNWAKGKDDIVAADIGTGSGAIAITIAKHTSATVHATDVSLDALTIAQQNASTNNVSVTFHQDNLAQPLIDKGIKVDLLMANLPYIATDDLAQLVVREHEPVLALDGGDDGLDLVRELIAQVPSICDEGALILLEIGMEQGQATSDLAQVLAPKSVRVIKDLAGLDRFVAIQL